MIQIWNAKIENVHITIIIRFHIFLNFDFRMLVSSSDFSPYKTDQSYYNFLLSCCSLRQAFTRVNSIKGYHLTLYLFMWASKEKPLKLSMLLFISGNLIRAIKKRPKMIAYNKSKKVKYLIRCLKHDTVV